jgi:crossover junction endodeoxyribonuclease RuvC
MTLRVLGIDPGLTRCGVGVVDVEPNRTASFVHVRVIRTPPDLALEKRLLAIAHGISEVLDEYAPDAVALERVFAQHNVRTVMGTAQASGVALQLAAARGLVVGLHTPSEVKAAVTGYGSADKRQVGAMVARVLRVVQIPGPADAADALAIALCHAWKGRLSVGGSTALTPAQEAWRSAEKSAAARRISS